MNMQYAALLVPHANARYQEALLPLSQAELQLLLHSCGIHVPCTYRTVGEINWLTFECDDLTPAQMRRISYHASLYFLCQLDTSGSFTPILTRSASYLGSDLPSILKYKGKTNEQFTEFMINVALFSGAFTANDVPYRLCDPLCGRGTTLLCAVNRGMNAVGVEQNKEDIRELKAFLKRYFEYHKLKYTAKEDSLTLPAKAFAKRTSYEFSDASESYKAGDRRSLTLVEADSRQLHRLAPKAGFHAIVADLPYGVQHAPGAQGKMTTFSQLMNDALPAWRETLVPGGAIALATNTYTYSLEALREALARAGYRVLSGGLYDSFSHWVEQAINRDVAVGIRP